MKRSQAIRAQRAGTLCACFVAMSMAALAPSALTAGESPGCVAATIAGPTTLLEVLSVDGQGEPLPGVETTLIGWGVILEGGVELPDGSPILELDTIESGVIENAGATAAWLRFSGDPVDQIAVPAAGEAVAVAVEVECWCVCDCKIHASSEEQEFRCESNKDDCAHNDENCVTSKGEAGTFKNCKKVWKPKK